MANKRLKNIVGAVAALGLTAFFLWLRDFIAWMRAGGFERQQQDYARRRMVQARVPAQQPIPMSGGPAAPAPAGTQQAGQSLVLEGLVQNLTQYLVSFHELVELARSRTQEGAEPIAGSALQPADRETFHATLARLDEQYPGYGPEALKEGSLQMRAYTLLHQVRETMANPNLPDIELYRVHDELKDRACKVLDEAYEAGAGAGPDFRYARTLYGCE